LVITAPGIFNLFFGYLRTKDFEFKLAKGWLRIMSKENDDFNKMKYFGIGMDYYKQVFAKNFKIRGQ
jgi:hypothetical protein